MPVNGDILALEIVDINWIKQHFKFNDLIPEFGRESDIDKALLVLIGVFECDDPLFNEVAALVDNFLIKLTEELWLSIVPLWQEDIMSLTIFKVHNFCHVWLNSGAIWGQNFPLMSKILFDINAEALVDSLIIILVVEEDLAFFGEAGDGERWAILILFIFIVKLR